MNTNISREHAQILDRNDELASYRQHFFIPDENLVYMDGNSLGRLPISAFDRVAEIVKTEWG